MGEYLKKKYSNFEEVWKKTQIPEIVAELKAQHQLHTNS